MNCTFSQPDNFSWIIAATSYMCVISFLGTVGNSISLWCLVRYAKMSRWTKFQLIFVFSILLTISLVILPSFTFISYNSIFCEVFLPKNLAYYIGICYSFFFQLERMNFTVIAVFRCLAVWRPHLFQKLSKMAVMVGVEAGICIYAIVICLAGLLMGLKPSTNKIPFIKGLLTESNAMFAAFTETLIKDNFDNEI
nr:uncharacterized protein LOC128705060 [Cherax quadricarinatus]